MSKVQEDYNDIFIKTQFLGALGWLSQLSICL